MYKNYFLTTYFLLHLNSFNKLLKYKTQEKNPINRVAKKNYYAFHKASACVGKSSNI